MAYPNALHGHVKIVNMLIEAGADVNAQNKRGETALFCAAWWGHVKCMESLLKAGADVNITDDDGDTALIKASRRTKHESVDVLLNAGADVNAKDMDDCTALHPDQSHSLKFNEYPNYVKCIRRLLRAGIHINKHHRRCGKNAVSLVLGSMFMHMSRSSLMLLYAAGETLDGTAEYLIPQELKFGAEKFQLKHICREVIRKHLLKLDLHSNLFGRIPRLGLSSALSRYLLFNQSLDDDDDNDQWRIRDFPEEGAPTPQGGAPTYEFAKISRKLHEIERIWLPRASLALPLRSSTDDDGDFSRDDDDDDGGCDFSFVESDDVDFKINAWWHDAWWDDDEDN